MDSPFPVTLPGPLSEVARWFAEEVHPHEPALRAYLRRHFPFLSNCDDVVQETYLRVLRAQGNGAIRSPKALLFAIARNVAIDCYRRQRMGPAEEGGVDFEQIPAGEIRDGRAGERELQLLEEAIESLPERCRQIIRLKKIEGLSYQAIAAKLGISPHTISAHVTAGVRKCRDYLRAHGVQKRPP